VSRIGDPYPGLAIAIETSSGAAVERLLDAGYSVFPINPKAAKHYRERKAPSGTKTDFVDAWSLADALRVDGHTWRALKPDDPLTVELRLLCRDEMALIEQRTAYICQLRAALHEYFPVALQAFDDPGLAAPGPAGPRLCRGSAVGGRGVPRTTGRSARPGPSSSASRRHRNWSTPGSAAGRNSCTRTSSITRRNSTPNGSICLQRPISSAAVRPSRTPGACWPNPWWLSCVRFRIT